MKKLLVLSPNFPPLSAPDLHRVRTSLPHFREFGWQPYVVAVDPAFQSGILESRLSSTIPADVPVEWSGALPLGLTRRLGVGSIALRAFLPLYRAGCRVIEREAIDLVYISTTMFAAMTLGRLWKMRFGTPFVLDMQDPWADDRPTPNAPLKRRLAGAMHRVLERFTMRKVDALVAVSAGYHQTLRRRYPWIPEDACLTLPFAACEADFDEAARGEWSNPFFHRDDDAIHGVYVGAVSDDMKVAGRILLRALHKVRSTDCPEARRLRLSFVGSSYAPKGRQQRQIDPAAEEERVADVVHESPSRLPYFAALRLMLDSQFVILLGSADAQYMPSKLFQCLLTRRPIVAVMHEKSPALDVLTRSRAAIVTTFRDADDLEAPATKLSEQLAGLVSNPIAEPNTDWSVIEPFRAREITRQQCVLFDAVTRHRLVEYGVANASHGF